MAIMPATLRQGQKLLAGTIETVWGEVPQEDLRLDYAIGRLVRGVGKLYDYHAEDTPGFLARDTFASIANNLALAFDLSGTTLEKLQATTSRDKHQALVGLHSMTSELLFFYGSNTSAFDLTLQRLWAYLIQHSPVIAGAPLAQIVGRS